MRLWTIIDAVSDKAADPAVTKETRKPAFLELFPEDARLAPLVEAYLSGNYARVREGASKLAQDASEPAVQRAATELLKRISPDPALRWMYWGASKRSLHPWPVGEG